MKNKVKYMLVILMLSCIIQTSHALVAVVPRILGIPANIYYGLGVLSILLINIFLSLLILDKGSLKYKKIQFYSLIVMLVLSVFMLYVLPSLV